MMRVTQDQGGLNEIFAFAMSSGTEHRIQVDWVLNKHPIIVLFPSFVNAAHITRTTQLISKVWYVLVVFIMQIKHNLGHYQ